VGFLIYNGVHMLTGFKGDISWVHDREDFRGAKSCYWPGGNSGVTLRPGVDVGHADLGLVRDSYQDRLTPEQWEAVVRAKGVRGTDARDLLANDPVLRSIRIPYEDGAKIFPVVARPYWKGILRVFPSILRDSTPKSIHTVFLSLAFNRGYNNKDLRELSAPLEVGDYRRVASIIGNMQQDHKVEGIRKRRKQEALIILSEVLIKKIVV
jgi:hypothetical protein